MWVADMDFRSPQPVIDALVRRAEHGIFGYPTRSDNYFQAIINWQKKRHGWETRRSWVITTPGVVPAISLAIQAFTQPGDKIVVQPPVYYPFFKLVSNTGRQIVENPLLESDGFYRMDYENLDTQLSDSRVGMMILCSPHNPVGRVWTREELTRLGQVCAKHEVLVVSDEIHSDLVFSWARHTPFAAISPEFEQNSVTLLAPSKTFNLAGLSTSIAIIPDDRLNSRFCHVIEAAGTGGSSIFGMTALEAAYTQGEEWLDQLLEYLEGNLIFLEQFFRSHIPEIQVRRPEGTYLVWLDCRALGLDRAGLRKFMIDNAGLGLNEGAVFGSPGEGYMRLNAACPRSVLEQSLERLARAVKVRN